MQPIYEIIDGYEIVPGRAHADDSTPVYRVVEYTDGECKGGLGSFFKLTDAQTFIAKHRSEKIAARLASVTTLVEERDAAWCGNDNLERELRLAYERIAELRQALEAERNEWAMMQFPGES